MRRVLVVCMGNICRSPVAERLLGAASGGKVEVSSAGLGALVGHPADALAAEVAAAHGISLASHAARQFTAQLGRGQDLILVMEPRYREAVGEQAPELLGRVMLYDQWTGGAGIPDPYGRSRAFHEQVFSLLDTATQAWAVRLSTKW